MDKEELIAKIGRGITHHSVWTIGITTNTARRKKEHKQDVKDIKWWHELEADSLSVARDVEKYFHDKGMRGGGGGDVDDIKTVYVYIFM